MFAHKLLKSVLEHQQHATFQSLKLAKTYKPETFSFLFYLTNKYSKVYILLTRFFSNSIKK